MQDTLFFDGQCPLCRREIRYLRRHHDGGLVFVDIHSLHPGAGEPSVLAMLRILHLRTADGEWLKGVDATVRAWSHTSWGWLFATLHWPVISRIAAGVYERWATRRYRRRYGCTPCMGAEE
jgi:predicted DCC family thiol-disulfide oxidoreductase YuxK